MRKGEPVEINFNELHVGDIVRIKPGMNIPWDAILVNGTGVTTDESAMTGESIELKKETMEMCEVRLEEKLEEEKFHKNEDKRTNHDLPSPILLSGTQIQTGEGWFMVIVVGKNSWVGKIFAKLNQEIEMTPLQEKLAAIATDIGYIGMIAAGITLVVLFARFFIETGIKGFDWKGQIGNYLNDWFGFLIISITIVVVAVPEGLPLAVMIALAYSVQKMLKDMNFVKRLASWEIMGGANNICSDKTGTLTKNMMTVKEIWQGEQVSLEIEDDNYVMANVISDEKTARLFLQACAWNTSGTSEDSNATEKAILKMLDKFGWDYQQLREKYCSNFLSIGIHPLNDQDVQPIMKSNLVRFQFTSKRKKMSTILTNITDNVYGYDKRLHTKGASEIVLSLCSNYITEDGTVENLNSDMMDYINSSVIEEFAKDGLRTIWLAYKDLRPNEGGITHEDDAPDGVNKIVEWGGLTWIGILGIRDVIRPEVPDAVKTFQNAGVRIRMVTGDNKITALAIAKEWGIITEEFEGWVMEGAEFYEKVGGLKWLTWNKKSPCQCDEK